MENLLLPTTIEYKDSTEPNKGTLTISPCYHGYGNTLGNSLRRVLLSSLPGAAVEGFKIKGVQHEFDTLKGVKEDVVQIMLNLKQLSLRVYSDEPVVLTLTKKGAGPVVAGDIKKDSNVEIISKDLVIANLTDDKTTLEMEIIVSKGRGFKPAEEKDRKDLDLGTMLIDSIYTPIRDVGYKVEFIRVGDITNYEKLIIEIETNGTMTPKEAVRQSTQILTDHFSLVMNEVGSEVEEIKKDNKKLDKEEE